MSKLAVHWSHPNVGLFIAVCLTCADLSEVVFVTSSLVISSFVVSVFHLNRCGVYAWRMLILGAGFLVSGSCTPASLIRSLSNWLSLFEVCCVGCV